MSRHVPPERWAQIEQTPTTQEGWVARLGGPPGGLLAVCGALLRGELVQRPDGLLAMPEANGQLGLDLRGRA